MKNPDAVTPEYAVTRLEQQLLLALIRGQYRAGDYLPSARRLAEMTGCSHTTVRSAVGRLVSRGLLAIDFGKGIRVGELLETCDLELLLMMVRDKSDAERALELEAQLLDLMSVFFLEVVYRAAAVRTDDHLKWFNHYLRLLHDRIDQDTHVAYLAAAQFQLMRVLAAAGGSVAFTILFNSFRSYLSSEAALELIPPDAWQHVIEAIEAKNVSRAREVFQRAFDRRTSRVLEMLAKVRGESDGGGESGSAAVELVAWGPGT